MASRHTSQRDDQHVPHNDCYLLSMIIRLAIRLTRRKNENWSPLAEPEFLVNPILTNHVSDRICINYAPANHSRVFPKIDNKIDFDFNWKITSDSRLRRPWAFDSKFICAIFNWPPMNAAADGTNEWFSFIRGIKLNSLNNIFAAVVKLNPQSSITVSQNVDYRFRWMQHSLAMALARNKIQPFARIAH